MSFIMVPLYGQLIVYLSSYLPTIVTYKESIRLTPKAHHPQPPPRKIWVNVTVSHDPGSCCVLDHDSGKKKKEGATTLSGGGAFSLRFLAAISLVRT